MNIKRHVSLIALFAAMVSLSQPTWSMEEERTSQGTNRTGGKSGEEPPLKRTRKQTKEGKTHSDRRTRKFTRKHFLKAPAPHVTTFNDLSTEVQAHIWHYALAQADSSTYCNISLVCHLSRAFTQSPADIEIALRLSEPRMEWEPPYPMEQDSKPLLRKLFVINEAREFIERDIQSYLDEHDDILFDAMDANPNSHVLPYYLASCLAYDLLQGYSIEPNIHQTLPRMRPTKDFIMSKLLEDEKNGKPLDFLKYDAFFRFYTVFAHFSTDYAQEENSPNINILEKELIETLKSIKNKKLTLTKPLDCTWIQKLRHIILLSPGLPKPARFHYCSLLGGADGAGDYVSQFHIAEFCRTGEFYATEEKDSKWPDEIVAQFWYKKIAKNKNHPYYAEACYSLGMLYLNQGNLSVTSNDEKGITYLKKAMEVYEPRARLEMANQYISGSHVKQDTNEGVLLLLKLHRQGEKMAKFFLFQTYEKTEIVPQALDAFLKECAAEGDGQACYEIGKRSIAQHDVKNGILWLTEGAHHYYFASSDLSKIYEKGVIVPQDMEKAMYFKRLKDRKWGFTEKDEALLGGVLGKDDSYLEGC